MPKGFRQLAGSEEEYKAKKTSTILEGLAIARDSLKEVGSSIGLSSKQQDIISTTLAGLEQNLKYSTKGTVAQTVDVGRALYSAKKELEKAGVNKSTAETAVARVMDSFGLSSQDLTQLKSAATEVANAAKSGDFDGAMERGIATAIGVAGRFSDSELPQTPPITAQSRSSSPQVATADLLGIDFGSLDSAFDKKKDKDNGVRGPGEWVQF